MATSIPEEQAAASVTARDDDEQPGSMLEEGHAAREAGAYEASRGRFEAAAGHHAHAAKCFDAAVKEALAQGEGACARRNTQLRLWQCQPHDRGITWDTSEHDGGPVRNVK